MDQKSSLASTKTGAKSRTRRAKEPSETARLFLDVEEVSRRSQSARPSRYVE